MRTEIQQKTKTTASGDVLIETSTVLGAIKVIQSHDEIYHLENQASLIQFIEALVIHEQILVDDISYDRRITVGSLIYFAGYLNCRPTWRWKTSQNCDAFPTFSKNTCSGVKTFSKSRLKWEVQDEFWLIFRPKWEESSKPIFK